MSTTHTTHPTHPTHPSHPTQKHKDHKPGPEATKAKQAKNQSTTETNNNEVGTMYDNNARGVPGLKTNLGNDPNAQTVVRRIESILSRQLRETPPGDERNWLMKHITHVGQILAVDYDGFDVSEFNHNIGMTDSEIQDNLRIQQAA